MALILNELDNELDYLAIEKIDIEDDSESVEKYSIRNIPTLILIKDTQIVDKIVGSVTKAKLLEIINKYK